MGEVSLSLFTLISFPPTNSYFNYHLEFVFSEIPSGLVLFLGIMTFLRIGNLIQGYCSFKNLQNELIEHQQEKLLQLLFEEDVDPALIHANRENLYRLASEINIPTSFPLFPLSILLPIFSAIIGYLILALENAPCKQHKLKKEG